jgi:hypothetical protein
MEESYDITESLLSAKADEGMIAFTGFEMEASEGLDAREGVLKISAFNRPGGDGYLTLTFLIDLVDDPARRSALQDRFHRADQASLSARLGRDFEMLLDIPLSVFAAAQRFHVEELNLYFKNLAGRERPLLEAAILPALAELLAVRFHPIDWVTPEETARPGTQPDPSAIRARSRRHPGV